MMKIYFCGSIRGGRMLAARYGELIRMLQTYGEVLTEHIGDDIDVLEDEDRLSDAAIYDRDMKWLSDADIVVAEVTIASIGVGYEIGSAVALKKPVVCLFDEGSGKRLSAMIAGCSEVTTLYYNALKEVEELISEFITMHAGGHAP